AAIAQACEGSRNSNPSGSSRISAMISLMSRPSVRCRSLCAAVMAARLHASGLSFAFSFVILFSLSSGPIPGPFLRFHPGKSVLTSISWSRSRRTNMAPESYWRLWADPIIHAIHLRVLEHVAGLAEREVGFRRIADARQILHGPADSGHRASTVSTARHAGPLRRGGLSQSTEGRLDASGEAFSFL